MNEVGFYRSLNDRCDDVLEKLEEAKKVLSARL